MDSSPAQERENAIADPLDELDWDLSAETVDTAWSRAHNARGGRAIRAFGARGFRAQRQFAMRKSMSMPLEDTVSSNGDSSPEFSRSSGRSVFSEEHSDAMLSSEEIPDRPLRQAHARSVSLFGPAKPTNLSQAMDFSRATSVASSDFGRGSSVSSMTARSSGSGEWSQTSSSLTLGEGVVCPPRPTRHRQARSLSMFGSTQPSNLTRCLGDADVPEPPAFLSSASQGVKSPAWRETSSNKLPASGEYDASFTPHTRFPRSSSMFGSITAHHTASSPCLTSEWRENNNPQQTGSALDEVEKHGDGQRQVKRNRTRRHSILGSVPPLSDMKRSSSSFSNLAHDPAWRESPTLEKLAFECQDLSEVPPYPSPERSVASSRKRGVCGSPLRDGDDWYSLSQNSTSSARKIRIFSPDFEEDIPFAPCLKPEPRRPIDADSDDGEDDSNGSPNASFISAASNNDKVMTTGAFDEEKSGSPEYILDTMSSYDDLKFLIKALRKQEGGKTGVASFASSLGWTVAPSAKWSSARRSDFLYWAKEHLRFTVRAAGADVVYLQVPPARGSAVRKNLEAALVFYKQKGGSRQVEQASQHYLILGSCTKPKRSSQTPGPTSTPFPPSKPVESPYCYATANLVAGIENLTVKESSDKKSTQKMIRTVTVDPQVPSAPSSRLSLEHHAHSHDFMNHLHGYSPRESEIHPIRMSLGKPPRFSTGSAVTANVVEPVDNLESFATPLVNDDESRWGSRPVDGRDWGGSSKTCMQTVDELLSRLDEACRQEGVRDSFGEPFGSSHLNLDLMSSEVVVVEQKDIASEPIGEIVFDGVLSEKKQKRRMLSFAKRKRMSLWASTVKSEGPLVAKQKPLFRNHKSIGRIGEIQQRKLSEEHEFPEHGIVTVQEEISMDNAGQLLLEEDALVRVFSFLTESELLCSASLVCTSWADAATSASVQRMLASVGRIEEDGEEDDELGLDDVSVGSVAITTAPDSGMERSWSNLNNLFPWGCFLSEGAFKKVFKVHNARTKQEEAVSFMDIDAIVDKKTVAAELAVSVMLSSLTRRAICPNFVVTRGVFTAPYAPAASHWGSADNKRPKGASFDSNKSYRNPREPKEAHPGRFQYIRMELCNEGDAEEYLKRQVDEAVVPSVAQALLFQIAFALHAAAEKFSVKHYDIKLLNIFMHRSEKVTGNLALRYGLGCHTFALKLPSNQALIAKVADYGTANICPLSIGQPVTIAQFTTIENTPPDFFILGDHAKQGHGHDCFGLGLCMLHLFTGHAPYEEILESVQCPPGLKKKLRKIWEDDNVQGYGVLRSVILSDVYKDEAGNIVDGDPDETPYDTLYRFLVLFGVPDTPFEQKKCPKVWKAISDSLSTSRSKTCKPLRGNSDASKYYRDCRKYSVLKGSNKYIARARKGLQTIDGGIELLLRLCSFDPTTRATAMEVLNSPFMRNLIESPEGPSFGPDDTVYSYTAFSTHR